jgi:hypothetical protein
MIIGNPDDICQCGARRKDHPEGAPDCKAWRGRHCYDCPDFDNDEERPPPPWTPRARCCRDEHLDRRNAGDTREWEGIEDARERSLAEEVLTETLRAKGANRAQRRADKAQRRRKPKP